MRGRKPKPAALKLIEGNPSHRKIGNNPSPPTKLPRCPSHLTTAAKGVWKMLGPRFAAMGVMAEVDEPAFAMLCEAYAAWRWLIKEAKGKPVVKVNGQPVPNPYLVRADREGEKVRKLLAEFGGSPSSRARLQTPPAAPPGDTDDLESFMKMAQ